MQRFQHCGSFPLNYVQYKSESPSKSLISERACPHSDYWERAAAVKSVQQHPRGGSAAIPLSPARDLHNKTCFWWEYAPLPASISTNLMKLGYFFFPEIPVSGARCFRGGFPVCIWRIFLALLTGKWKREDLSIATRGRNTIR